jgi:hypothetical protein
MQQQHLTLAHDPSKQFINDNSFFFNSGSVSHIKKDSELSAAKNSTEALHRRHMSI